MAKLGLGLASSTAITLTLALMPSLSQAQDSDSIVLEQITVTSAEEQVKQALGASTVTAEDIARQPVVNDVSEIIRKMPGVNLTGSSATGQRGNQRQIDIRGMGPENTLILIDGKPVLSRNSVRMTRSGERDSRGDSNWVPAELIDHIEVLRGPAAARYGSGAAGGVVNIITKEPEHETFSFSAQMTQPESSLEGSGQRANFLYARPLGQNLTFRLTGNYNKTDADSPDINASVDDTTCSYTAADSSTVTVACPAAGREGVVNKDLTAQLRWKMDDANTIDFDASYSRQGNIFTGDRQNSSVNETLEELAAEGAETNVMKRQNFALTHRGDYAFGTSESYIQWEHTDNTRNLEGLAGGPEGSITSTEKGTVLLDNINAKTEWVLPMRLLGKDSSLTLGAEIRHERLNDPISTTQTITSTTGEGIDGTETGVADRQTVMTQVTAGIYAEANIYWSDALTLTPALRLDQNEYFGLNASPSLNAALKLSDSWTAKFGIARAFKAPNLYQLNNDYVYYTRGNGCPTNYPSLGSGCYVVGNEDLDAETSINTELGLAYAGAGGTNATITAFHNDYRNKIQAGNVPVGTFETGSGTAQYFQWVNIPKAVVSGVEGSFSTPLGPNLDLATNVTYMIESKNSETGEPLSLVPDYTINLSMNWQATDKLMLTPSLTHYGRIQAASTNTVTGAPLTDPQDRDPYTLVNLGARYALTDSTSLSAGISNVFDVQVLREGSSTSAGANSYNESGRAFYIGLNATF
jgi:ferric enterobactin receptor